MTDSQIRDRLHSAVDTTTAPPGFAQLAVRGGRARRRRRYAAGTLVAAVVVAAGAALLPSGSPPAEDGQPASGGALADQTAFDWAGSLPEGVAPGLPYFAYGKLWSGEDGITLPPTVNVTVGPWAVEDGWIVMTGKQESNLAWAVLSPAGELRNLPSETYDNGLGLARFDVSPDGRQAATEQWLVDLTAMTATELPHAPKRAEDGGYATQVRPRSFTDQGLVYEAGPYTDGSSTTYLLQADGSTVPLTPPDGTFTPDNSPGDVAVDYAYTADGTDTCVTSYRLTDARWRAAGNGCMGKSLGEALSISPDGRWLITDDMPRVWNLEAGAFATLDMPREVVTSRGEGLVGGVVWESGDAFLMPVADRSTDEGATSGDFDQFVHVVRCRLSTSACELAATVENRVVSEAMSNSEFHFPTS